MTSPAFAPHRTTVELYNALGPGITDGDLEAGGLLLRLLDAVGQLLGDVDDRVRDTADGFGWQRELDPDTTLSPAWLGAFVGVTIPDGTPLARARQLILERRAFRRGSPDAMLEAARELLTGTKRVDLFERDGSPYRLRVRTYESETPDPARVRAALEAAKPAGLVLVHEVYPGAEYDERDARFATYNALDASAATYDQLDRGGV